MSPAKLAKVMDDMKNYRGKVDDLFRVIKCQLVLFKTRFNSLTKYDSRLAIHSGESVIR